MYQQYWQVTRHPFENRFDSRYFFPGESHQAALLKMRYVIQNQLGAGVLVGSTGIGKTFALRTLQDQLDERTTPFVHIGFPQLSSAELLGLLAAELGAETDGPTAGRRDLSVRRIDSQLRHHASQGTAPVIVIDDAHLIDDPHVLQTLSLLLNLQQDPAITFTLILIGEPVLLGQIQRVAHLSSRIAVRSVVQPLGQPETADYIAHRLAAAECPRSPFDKSAVRRVFELSGGNPRRINQLCDLALLVGYADQLPSITQDEITAVSAELSLTDAA